jgi:hypothetical protein
MHQIQLIEIKETAEKGGDGKSKPTNEKRERKQQIHACLLWEQ